MTAYNVVRFRVKPGQEEAFLEVVKTSSQPPGSRRLAMIKTGERSYCLIGEWNGMNDLVAARPAMIADLDKMRDMLEDLGGGLGVTDPVSGDVVLELK